MINKEKRKIMNGYEKIYSMQESSMSEKDIEELYYKELKPYVYEDAQKDFLKMFKIALDIEGLFSKAVRGDERLTQSELNNKLDHYSNQSKEIYTRNTDSGWPFDYIYMFIIDRIQYFDLENVNIDKVAKQAREIYEKTDNKPSVAQNYIDILFNLSLAQMDRNERDKIEDTLEEGKKVIESTLFYLKKYFVKWIIDYICVSEYIQTDEQMDIDETEKIITNNNDIYIACQWIFKLVGINSSERAEYEPLINSLENFKSYPDAIFIIMNIYRCVEDIKYQLVIKDFSKYKFGHYTSGSVLQIFLKQEDSVIPHKIKGKTRLYNVRYMNDPEEGKIIDKILGLGYNNNPGDKVESSPWFLMSLTTALDELTMWSQYGANAEGVCLELKPDSFSKVNSLIDMKPFFHQVPSSEKTVTINNANEYLYRICYLDEEALKKDEIEISELHNELLKDDDVINSVKKSLVQIKEILAFKLDDAQKQEELLYDVNKLLEEIRYLFKSSGYYYEKEIRLLKYSELNPNNTEIKVHNMSPVAKLYIERESSIQINKITFGPKFKEPENVTPLVHLLDNEIICVRSSKKFK